MQHDNAITKPGFSASRLAFRLSEKGGQDAPSDARVTVCPICEAPRALHVDEQRGCDQTGDGSAERPLASLRGALRTAVERGQTSVYIATTDA